MKLLTTLAIILLFSGSAFANDHHGDNQPMSWNIDQAHSNILFTVSHFFNKVPGTFNDFSGTIVFNPSAPEMSEIDVQVNVASVNTNVERRDDHLRSGDFFGAEEFPMMHFRSTDVRHVDGQNFVAHGQLTIKDVTREVELPFEFLGVTDHLMREGVMVAGLHGELSLNRNDFGVGVGDWASTAVIGGDVNIQIMLQVHDN
ncbi:Polyisoprenoid-binding protein YceI [Cyclonatronum proteinivorum]|uniref:Polyisoprenoid-binding protein YceI n=1 Tax=Cyclonatronum proteinivorum TaxID=1457365 RepID=A0A345UIC3_9BACT|nr:YceI family protein [Cyclonatronum proteinivorum]AXJ00225.1 Polyisoprenoid-binding protein YceI [Cyclonatronum proteinivorum]